MEAEAPPDIAELERLPDHVLFPDAYRRTASMIRQDFVFYGLTLVGSLLAVRFAEIALAG